jgi:Family of unknown function (DUF5684)
MISLLQFSLTPGLALVLNQPLFAQETSEPTASPVAIILPLFVFLLVIVAMWRIFSKAGQPGWASLIPIYNLYVWCKIVGRAGWWVILMLIPFINFIILFVLSIDMAKSFGKGAGFGIGLALLSIIFLPILAFSGAEYQGPSAAS